MAQPIKYNKKQTQKQWLVSYNKAHCQHCILPLFTNFNAGQALLLAQKNSKILNILRTHLTLLGTQAFVNFPVLLRGPWNKCNRLYFKYTKKKCTITSNRVESRPGTSQPHFAYLVAIQVLILLARPLVIRRFVSIFFLVFE